MTAHAGYNLTSSDGTTPQFGVGDEVNISGAQYKYLVAGEDIAQYALVSVSNTNEAVEGTTTTSGAKPTLFAIPQFAVLDNEYFWAPIGPFTLKSDGTAFQVKGAASCAANVKLYTTGTDGVVDDDATDLVAGLCLTETLTDAGAADCIAVCRLVSNCQD